MQPYVFPYLGYFQLIRCSDFFVFYDDVQFMKGGWVNRNRITNQGKAHTFTIPARGGSMHSRIMDVACGVDVRFRRKFLRQLEQEYRKASCFEPVSMLVAKVLDSSHDGNLSRLAITSVEEVFRYLELPINVSVSSRDFPREGDIKGPERVIAITRKLGGDRYVNLPGGARLYDHDQFAKEGIDLRFIKDRSGSYVHFADPFEPRLSIIDVLMHNCPDTVREMLTQYDLLTQAELAAELSENPLSEGEQR